MKTSKLITHLLISLGWITVIYFLFSFTKAELNPFLWSEDERMLAAYLYFVVAFVSHVVYGGVSSDKK